MSVTSNRTTSVAFTGDITLTVAEAATANTTSPGSITLHTLASGANTITLPTGGSVPVAATIVPPVSNTNTLTLKGVTGDTGVGLHLTDPAVVTLATTTTSFCITAGGAVTGLRIIWS
jgi:hypothetical protein